MLRRMKNTHVCAQVLTYNQARDNHINNERITESPFIRIKGLCGNESTIVMEHERLS